MALFRCNKCGHLREVPDDYIGKSVKCPRCKQIAPPIHDTVAFVKNVLKKYRFQYKELHQLRQQVTNVEESEIPADEQQSLEAIDIYNTGLFSST